MVLSTYLNLVQKIGFIQKNDANGYGSRRSTKAIHFVLFRFVSLIGNKIIYMCVFVYRICLFF